MKKYFVSSVLAVSLATCLVAEESGAFVGVGLGYGGANIKSESKGVDINESIKIKGGGLSYEIIAGYRQFFTQSFGLRYYAHFSYADIKFKESGISVKGNLIKYGVNVDALYNFISNDSLDFGAFLGLGLGANTWGGEAFDDGGEEGVKLKKTGFDLGLNVGLRTLIAKHHGIEIAAKVPFLGTKFYEENFGDVNVKSTASHTYNVGVRYVFNF